jgi:methylthioribose-1-phosphate isomerase
VKIDGKPYRSIWTEGTPPEVRIIDQTRLPYALDILTLETAADAAHAIRTMQVRGAPCIGATAAYGVALAMRTDPSDAGLEAAVAMLGATRPTAVNLRWALEEMTAHLRNRPHGDREDAAFARAAAICDDDVEICRSIGAHGLPLIEAVAEKKASAMKEGPVNILTHCNAGWIATVDWGTALAPIYMAHDKGIPVHVWVDETRPRNQGLLTAWELSAHGIPNTMVVDNAGGHLMQAGQVDLCIVGTDRTTRNGDVANKIGTYLKALAAHDQGVPFYVGLPHTTIDWTLSSGADIPIEERAGDEVTHVAGRSDGTVSKVALGADGLQVANPAFDVTPARLVTGLITERGIADASEEGLLALYPERADGTSGAA